MADSVSPHGFRLVTYEVVMPRFILPQFNKHRMLSSNTASSRAIPTEKLLEEVKLNPFIPELNERVKGMGVGEPLSGDRAHWARQEWLQARNDAVRAAERLLALNVDKSRVNRLLEPFLWVSLLVTGTDWGNFFALRTSSSAQPEFQQTAVLMQQAYEHNRPWQTPSYCWHLPLVELSELAQPTDYDWWKRVSTARCARISYLTHDGKRDPAADIGLHNRLLTDHHLSPFEHVARPFTDADWEIIRDKQDRLRTLYGHRLPEEVEEWCRQLEYSGNLRGWRSYRVEIPNQHDLSLAA